MRSSAARMRRRNQPAWNAPRASAFSWFSISADPANWTAAGGIMGRKRCGTGMTKATCGRRRMFPTLTFVVRVVMYNVRFVPSPAAAYVTAVAWGLPLLSSVDRVPNDRRRIEFSTVARSVTGAPSSAYPAPIGWLVAQLHAVYGASEGTGGRRIIENSTGDCICFLRAKLHMVGSGDSNFPWSPDAPHGGPSPNG